jgi:hypothetical protein
MRWELSMRKILKHLGYPLYPVGVADESVGPSEVRKLRELICRYWVPWRGPSVTMRTMRLRHIINVFDQLLGRQTFTGELFVHS